MSEPIKPSDDDTARAGEDSAVVVLQHLNDERGKMFTEADYAELRAAVLDELAHGASLRPFTWFTFGVIAVGLIAMIAVGVVTARSHSVRDHLLTIVSSIAFVATVGFMWNLARGVKLESRRSIATRLAELDELHEKGLISPDEFQMIRASVLIARQRSGEA